MWNMRRRNSEAEVLAQKIDNLNTCPSGALAYRLEAGGETVGLDFSHEAVVVRDGRLRITGGVLLERFGGLPLETRDRVNLCRREPSSIKPLGDGTHKEMGY